MIHNDLLLQITGHPPKLIDRMTARFPDMDIVFVESGGDNLAATFSPELADVTIYVIDVAAGDKIPRKGGRAITAQTSC